MSQKTVVQQTWAVASYALQDAYTDFILSRQAMLCSPKTIRFYHFTVGRFVKYLEENGITTPEDTSARHIRAYLSELVAQDLSDSYIHGHARAIKTLSRFWHKENYLPPSITFKMPKIAKKRLPVLSKEDLKGVLAACTNMNLIESNLNRVCQQSKQKNMSAFANKKINRFWLQNLWHFNTLILH